MGDLDKNIHRKEESSPYGEIITNPIEKDKREKEESYKSLKNATKTQVLASLLSYFKKMLYSLGSKKSITHSFDEQSFLKNTFKFRELLILLSREDRSHNPRFGEELSQSWHRITDVVSSPSFPQDFPSEDLYKIKFFISQVDHFPLEADHTLGYYFMEYAGKKWIPFPFMELLQRLHEEYQSNPSQSILYHWITLLNEILTSSDADKK